MQVAILCSCTSACSQKVGGAPPLGRSFWHFAHADLNVGDELTGKT
jgi:hypothetical protein